MDSDPKISSQLPTTPTNNIGNVTGDWMLEP